MSKITQDLGSFSGMNFIKTELLASQDWQKQEFRQFSNDRLENYKTTLNDIEGLYKKQSSTCPFFTIFLSIDII